MISVLVAKNNNDAVVLAKLAIKYHLYINGWQLIYVLKAIKKDGIKAAKIALAFDDIEKKPVAVSIRLMKEGWAIDQLSDHFPKRMIMCFVAPKYRRNGVGTEVVKVMKTAKRNYSGKGKPGSPEFWYKTGVQCKFS